MIAITTVGSRYYAFLLGVTLAQPYTPMRVSLEREVLAELVAVVTAGRRRGRTSRRTRESQ